MLNDTNFKYRKENVMIVLRCKNLDLTLWMEQPHSFESDRSTEDKKTYEKWNRFNQLSLIIMRYVIPETFRGTMSEETTAREFLNDPEKRFAKNEKVKTSTLLVNLVSMWYKAKGNIREYILEMSNIASKLKAFKLELSKDLLVHLVLISLPAQFNQFKVMTNGLLMSSFCIVCKRKRDRSKIRQRVLIWLPPLRTKARKKLKTNEAAGVSPKKQQKQIEFACYFCKKCGHKKGDCTKYHAWCAKKELPKLSNTK